MPAMLGGHALSYLIAFRFLPSAASRNLGSALEHLLPPRVAWRVPAALLPLRHGSRLGGVITGCAWMLPSWFSGSCLLEQVNPPLLGLRQHGYAWFRRFSGRGNALGFCCMPYVD